MGQNRLLVVCIVLAAISVSTAHAQFSSDYQTNIISGVASNWSGDYIVGNDTAFDLLVIENGGVLSNGLTYFGFNTSATNNGAIVSGSNSVWRTYIVFGYSGSGCELTITNGGHLEGGGEVGHETASSNNMVVITGVGSVWSNRDLVIGWRGGRNYLAVSNGGHVYDRLANVGEWLSSSNFVSVTGIGSIWSNSNSLFFGDDSSGNQMIISNGGAVFNTSGYIGTSSAASNNIVTVDGSGSVWANSYNLFIGYSGGANRLVVTNGGSVYSAIAGIGDSGDSNTVTVTGTGSTWSNSVDISMGYGRDNRLAILDGGLVENDNAHIGPSCETVIVSGSGSMWNNLGRIYIGNGVSGNVGSSNQIIVADGGCVIASNIYVGSICGGSGNGINVLGGSLYVTNADHGGTLDVRFGQVLLNSGSLKVDILIVTNACGHFIHTGGNLVVGTLVLDPNLSAVDDGIPNSWKQQYRFDPFDPTVASADPDGDGQSNLAEYLAGTDPMDSTSTFRIISISQEEADVRVTWRTGIGKTNTLQAATDFSGGFADIFAVTNAVGNFTNYLDIGAVTNFPSRFYRIRIAP